jgi:hypothetical protein
MFYWGNGEGKQKGEWDGGEEKRKWRRKSGIRSDLVDIK